MKERDLKDDPSRRLGCEVVQRRQGLWQHARSPPVSKVWLTDVSLKLKHPVLLWSRTSVVEAVSLLCSLGGHGSFLNFHNKS